MKRLNLKLVISLVVGTLVMVAGVLIAHTMQQKGTSSELKQHAEKLAQDGKRDEALKKYFAYLKQNPDDAEVHLTASKLAVEIADEAAQRPGADRQIVQMKASEAYEELNRAFRAGNNRDNREFRKQFAEFLMRNNVFDKAKEHFQWLTSSQRGKTHQAKLDLELARCYAAPGQDKYDEAMKIYAGLTGFDLQTFKFVGKGTAPKEVEAYIMMADYLRQKADRKQPKAADAVMEKLVEVNGDSSKAHLERSKYLFRYQAAENEKTRDEWKALGHTELAAAQKLAPEDPDVILFAAEVAANIDNNPDKAEKLLAHGIELNSKNVSMYALWANIKKSQNKLDEASKKIEVGIKKAGKVPSLLVELVDVKLQQRDFSGANDAITTLSEMKYDVDVEWWTAMMSYYQGKWLEAAKKFEQLRPRVAGSPIARQADINIAVCYEKLGEPDKQIEASRRALAADKTSLDGMIVEASALSRLGKVDEANAKFEVIGQTMFKDRGSIAPDIWVQIFQGRIRNAMKQPAKERDWSRVDALIKYLEQKAPNDVSTALAKAEVQYRKEDSKAAIETLEKCLAANPKDVHVWSALIRSLVLQKDSGPQGALKRLEKAPPEVRDDVLIRLARAEALMQLGADNLKAALPQLESGSDKMTATERLQLWSGLGVTMMHIGDRAGAIRYWTKVADDDPGDINIRMNSLLDAAREDGNEPVMNRVLADVQRLTGSKTSVESLYVQAAKKVSLLWKSIRDRSKSGQEVAMLQSDEKEQLASARDLLNQVSLVRPGWYQATKILGDIEAVDGNDEAAIDKYETALETGPPSAGTIRNLAMLLSKHKRTEELNKIVAKINEQFGSDALTAVGLPRVEAEALLKAATSDEAAGMHDDAAKKFDQCIATAKMEVPDDSPNPLSHLWIANIYDRANKPEQAEASYRRAVKAGPTLPDTWLLLVGHLADQKKTIEAQQVLIDARKQLPEDKVNQVLGPGYEALGEGALAEQYYRAALEASPKDLTTHRLLAMFFMRVNRMDDAKKEVAIVLRGAQNDSKNRAYLVWARRALSDILADTGTREDFFRAKALLVENTKMDNPDVEDQIRIATLLARRADEPAMLREALDRFGNVPSADLSADDRIKIAKLHEALGDWNIARQQLLDLVAKSKPGPAAYEAFVEMLIRNNDLSDAEKYIERLGSIDPVSAFLLRTEVLVKLGKNREAIALLSQIRPKKPVPKEKYDQVSTVAVLMDQLGLNDEAEKFYREYMEYQPTKGSLRLAAFFGRNGRLDEALDLLEPRITERELRPEDRQKVLQALSDVLHGKPNLVQPQHLERVKGWLDQLLREDPESIPLLLQIAGFQLVTGQDDRAEKSFRDVLARSDISSVQRGIASNDLAFVLATQQRNLPEALDLVNRAGSDLGFTSDILDTRGMVYLAMKKYREAAADFSESLLVTNPGPTKYLHLAWAQYKLLDHSRARQSLRKAMDAKLDVPALSKIEKGYYEKLFKDIGP
jgi:tetratricopeptide (TPR) repeat protein